MAGSEFILRQSVAAESQVNIKKRRLTLGLGYAITEWLAVFLPTPLSGFDWANFMACLLARVSFANQQKTALFTDRTIIFGHALFAKFSAELASGR